MAYYHQLVIALGLFLLSADAQTSLGTSICAQGSPLTAFSACNYLYSQIGYCAGPSVASGAPYVSCYCNQQVLNAFFNCESEERLCFGDDNEDGDIQSGINQWHSACDARISFTPTTPVLSTVTAAAFCEAANSACASGVDLASQCSLSYTLSSPQFSSCFCQPRLLSLEYTCLYQANVSCYSEPATLTNLPAYKVCQNAASVYASIASNASVPVSTPASTTGSMSSSSGSHSSSTGSITSSSITRPVLPGSSSTTSGPQSTSSSYGHRTSVSMEHLCIVLGSMFIWMAVSIGTA